MLQEKLNKQVKIAAWQFGLGFGVVIGYLLFAFGMFFMGYIGWIIGGIIVAVSGIAQFVLWILGIVNAVQINNITNDSAILLVFSIITFWFGHFIVAISHRKRFAGYTPRSRTEQVTQPHPQPQAKQQQTSFESKLKQSFMDGVISADEYNKKLKAHQNSTKK